jgi:hypothetical protein
MAGRIGAVVRIIEEGTGCTALLEDGLLVHGASDGR